MREWLSSEVHVEGDGGLLRAAFAASPGAWLPPPARSLDHRRWLVGVRWGGRDRLISCRLSPYVGNSRAGWRHLI